MDFIPLGNLALWVHPPAGKKKARARVLIIHGISEHSGRHANTIEALTGDGYEVIRFDLRGSGRSGGQRQWISRFEDYVDDVIAVFNWICRSRDEMPLFVLGHSMGGAIATHFAASYGGALRGLVLSAPAYRVGSAVSPLTIAVGRALVHVAPQLRIPKGVASPPVSRDMEVVRAYLCDPLCFHQNTVQQGNEVLRALGEMPEKTRRVHAPVMIAHGTHDRIIRLDGSFELMKSLGSTDRVMHCLPGVFHEPHNDLDKEQYFALLLMWLKKHL